MNLRIVIAFLLLFIFIGGISMVVITKFVDSNKTVPVSLDSYKFQASSYTIPSSNLEWLSKEVVIPKDVLKKMILATTVTGKIADSKLLSGRLSGFSEYYTGSEKGYYAYEGYIRLKPLDDGKVKSFYFSSKRMNIMRVIDKSGKKINFDDLKIGEVVEIEETVDLAILNIDDKNVISLTVAKVD